MNSKKICNMQKKLLILAELLNINVNDGLLMHINIVVCDTPTITVNDFDAIISARYTRMFILSGYSIPTMP